MLKCLFFLFNGLLFCQYAMAQKSDTLLYFVKNSGEITNDKDSAAFAEYVLPYDKSIKLYPVYLFYANGKQRLTGAAKTRSHNGSLSLLEGVCTYYYQTVIDKANTSMMMGKLSEIT